MDPNEKILMRPIHSLTSNVRFCGYQSQVCFVRMLCENSEFAPFWCLSFSESNVFVAQLNERSGKPSHFRRFLVAPIVFIQPLRTAEAPGALVACAWAHSET